MPCLTAVCHSLTSLDVQSPRGWKGAFICPRIQPSPLMSLCQIVHGCMSTCGFMVVLVTRLELAGNSMVYFCTRVHYPWSGSDLQFGVQVAGWARRLCLQFKYQYNTPGSVSVASSAEWNQTADSVNGGVYILTHTVHIWQPNTLRKCILCTHVYTGFYCKCIYRKYKPHRIWSHWQFREF